MRGVDFCSHGRSTKPNCAGLPRSWIGLGAASVAQLAEQLICNQPVVGSNPSAGSGLPERDNETRDKGSSRTQYERNKIFWGFARVVKGGGL
jgi:hypothetical protein